MIYAQTYLFRLNPQRLHNAICFPARRSSETGTLGDPDLPKKIIPDPKLEVTEVTRLTITIVVIVIVVIMITKMVTVMLLKLALTPYTPYKP